MNVTFTPLLHAVTVAALSLLTASPQLIAQEPPQRQFLIDTLAGTFAGIKFKVNGAEAIQALPFNDPNEREEALRKFAEFMEPPRKKSNLRVQVPGTTGVTLLFNAYSGQFAQLQVASNDVQTTEGLGVGNLFEDFVAQYGEPQVREYPNNVVLYTFSTSNPAVTISLYSNASPVKAFMVAYDLRK